MDDLNPKPLFPLEQPPKVDPAYFQKIDEEMKVLAEKIPVVAKQPSKKEVWCKIGDLWYGHPVTKLILRYRALMWLRANPPDPRGQKFAKRLGPYVVRAQTKDFMEVFDYSERHIQRILAEARKALERPSKAIITVEEFCHLNGLNEDTIQKKLDEVYTNRWNRIKNKHPLKKPKDDDD